MLTGCSYFKLKILKINITSKYHERYKNIMRKKDTCVISLVMFYETETKNITKLYRVLSGVIYSVIENYVCIDYLYCHRKKIKRLLL